MNKEVVSAEIRRELLQRGFSRRTFGRFAALMSAGATLPFYNEAALAQGLSAVRGLPPDAVRINANENPLGPCPEASEAIYNVVQKGGRYLYEETFEMQKVMADLEGVGGGFGMIEQLISRLEAVPVGEQLGETQAGRGRHGQGDGLKSPDPAGMIQGGGGEVDVRPEGGVGGELEGQFRGGSELNPPAGFRVRRCIVP